MVAYAWVRGLLTHGHRYTVYQNDRVPQCDPEATRTEFMCS